MKCTNCDGKMKKLLKKKQYKNRVEFNIADLNAILASKHIVKAFGSIRFVKDEIKRLRKSIKGCIASFYFPEKTSKSKQKSVIENFIKRFSEANVITASIAEKKRKSIEVEVFLVY